VDTHLWMHGNLVADPTQKVVANGQKLTRFRIASSGRRYDEASGGWVNTNTVYMSVTCWRQLGDHVMQSLRKGDTVLVRGRLKFSEYDDANGGPRRQSYEIEAASVGPDLYRYITALTRPTRELPDADAAVAVDAAVAGVPAQPVDDPWSAPIPGSAAEETAA
jgi:single-strand DNA-binding protein